MAFHAETSPITLVGDEFLGPYACSNPSCIKDDLSLLVLELDEEVVASLGRGIHCKVEVIRSEWVKNMHLCDLHCAWLPDEEMWMGSLERFSLISGPRE